MSLQTPPYVISAASHPAALFRQAFGAPLRRGGVFSAGEFVVTQQSTPGMSVQVAAGRIVVPGTQLSAPYAGANWTPQGSYFAVNDAPATVTIASSNPTNARIDVVYVAARDAFYSGSNNDCVLQVATGVPSASPVVPAIPANAYAVAYVAVGANVTSIVNANVSVPAGVGAISSSVGGIMPVPNSTSYPTAAWPGGYVDDPTFNGPVRWDGTNWVPVVQGGRVAYTLLGSGYTAGAVVSYPLPFTVPPIVAPVIHGALNHVVEVSAVSATNFTYRIFRTDLTPAGADASGQLDWVAFQIP